MFSPERLAARWPRIWDEVTDRLTDDRSLYDRDHRLRNGIDKQEARAVLLLAAKTARKCGFDLIFSAEEKELMSKKFIKRQVRK